MTDRKTTITETRPLVGNRLVLIGALLYLLEWVAIIAAKVDPPLGADASTRDLVAAYDGVQSLAWAAGWFSVVLLGRVLIMVGLRTALDRSGRDHPLMGLAVAAMLASVVVEIATYAIVSGAAWAHAHGSDMSTLRGLDATAFQLNQMIFGPLGVAVLCAGIAMWTARLFPRVLSGLALVSGVLLILAGAAATAPKLSDVMNVLTFGVLAFWVWMLWLGVLLWRSRRGRSPAGDEPF